MPRARKGGGRTNPTGGDLGFGAELWRMADALRGSMDAADYKHVVLGLIFLKYISDAFEEQHARLVAEQTEGADPEDPDEYRAHATGNGNGGRARADIWIYGQESNYATWRLAKMNLATRGSDGRVEQPVVCRVAPRHGTKCIAQEEWKGGWNHAYS
ncbi:MAG: Type I restriction-modification system, DNA-methyltransferase subunit M [Candidatus Bipolaricaulis sibiricus]|uniref:site-specific DNA-methyltransferase (adenine-specific) n=1 Tax=Bipolaricaulis sibiricus TaxID=2501609 RepID=A0A410FUW2_BIPS1|nr:MAG: Type I restriction-modification system, DNA-methyltransferase subunit M [Candidatus Bipolaricaulis sibiricus]